MFEVSVNPQRQAEGGVVFGIATIISDYFTQPVGAVNPNISLIASGSPAGVSPP